MRGFALISLFIIFKSIVGQQLANNGTMFNKYEINFSDGDTLEGWYSFKENYKGSNDLYWSPRFGLRSNTLNWATIVPLMPDIDTGIIAIRLSSALDKKGSNNYYYSSDTDARMYMGNKLIQNLIIGHKYRITYFLKNRFLYYRFPSYDPPYDTLSCVPSDRFMVSFTTYLPAQHNADLVSCKVHYKSDKVFLNYDWTEFNFVFVADSNYKYINFGNFLPDNDMKLRPKNSNPLSTNDHNMLFDNLSVIDLDAKFSINKQDSICFGDTFLLSVKEKWDSRAIVKWYNGAGQLLAVGDTFKQSLSATTKIIAKCDLLSDSVTVRVIKMDADLLRNDTGYCKNGSVTITAENPDYTYSWSNGQKGRSIQVNTAGKYWVTATQYSCKSSDTINVTEYPLPVFSLHQLDTTCYLFDKKLKIAATPNTYTYQWQPVNYTGDTLTAPDYENLTCTAKNQYGCIAANNINIIRNCYKKLFVPTAFTPDNDGKNDYFEPICEGADKIRVLIINRWGQVVYKTEQQFPKWDGKLNQQPCANGVYYCQVTAYLPEGETTQQNLMIKLLR